MPFAYKCEQQIYPSFSSSDVAYEPIYDASKREKRKKTYNRRVFSLVVKRKKSKLAYSDYCMHISFSYFQSVCNKHSIAMSHSHGTLEVTILEGRHLKDEDVVGKDDAYIELYLDKDYKQRTKTIQNSNDPTWNQTFTL
jgi:Ca2+-dependent lipid-binding protein